MEKVAAKRFLRVLNALQGVYEGEQDNLLLCPLCGGHTDFTLGNFQNRWVGMECEGCGGAWEVHEAPPGGVWFDAIRVVREGA
jgi:hypothetical protein